MPDRRFSHRQDFLGRHSVDARNGSGFLPALPLGQLVRELPRARARLRGNEPLNRILPAGPARPPARSTATPPGRNIQSCASCHDQATRRIASAVTEWGESEAIHNPAGVPLAPQPSEAQSDGRARRATAELLAPMGLGQWRRIASSSTIAPFHAIPPRTLGRRSPWLFPARAPRRCPGAVARFLRRRLRPSRPLARPEPHGGTA